MTEITKACIVAFKKARSSLVVWWIEKKKNRRWENVIFKALSTGLHEKVISGLDIQFVKKILLEMAIGQQVKEKGYDQN